MSQISQDKVPDFLPHHAERVGKVSQFIQELAELKQKFKDAVEEGPSNYKMVVVMKEQLDSMYRDAIVMNQELFASKHLSGDDFERTKESLIESKESVEAMYQDYLNTNLKSSSKKASSCKSHSSAMKLLELQAKEAEERVQREMERISLEEELELHQLEAEKKKVQQRKKLLMLEAKERASSEIARIKQALVIEEDCETSTVSSLHLPRQHNLAEKSEPGPSEVKITEVSPPLETRIVSQNDPVVSTGPACSRVDFGPIPTSFGKSSACPIASSFAFPRQQVDPIVQTSPSQASNEILDLKKALVEAMTETRSASFRPRVEIDKFNGNPLRFFRFLHQFDSHVGGQFQDSKRKLDLLLSLCTGEALRAIEGCLFLSPDIGYQEARKRLEQRFGQHIVIIEAYVEKLTSGPPIKETDHNGLTSLADDMFNCLMTLRGWGGVASLDLQDNLRKIYSRLPSFSRERFDGVYCKLYKEGRVPTFKDLTEFVQEEATRASTFFKRQHFQAEKAVSKPRSKPTYGSKAAPRTAVKVSTFATQRVDTNVQKGTPLQKPQIACVVCSSQHPLWKCESFKQKSPTERWQIAKSAGACFNCLSTTHKATDCGSRFGCKTCAGRHHTLLHGKFNNEADSVATSKGTTVASENNEEAKKVAFSVNSKRDARKVKRFKVVPVEVWGADPSNSACTYAFLDDGSDSSIITKGLMRKLGLMHSDDHCKVITANSVSDHQIVAAPLHVKGVEEEQIFCFKDVVVFDELTDISESIPTNKVARMYPHLKDIEFPELSSNSVELLLGNDTHEAFKIVDQRYGEYGQPFGLKTMLGWTLFGADSSMKKIECECSKAIHVNFLCNSEPTVSCDHVLQKLGSDFLDVEQDYETSPSIEDKQARRKMEDSITKVGSHYQVGLPWRSEACKPHNNRKLAEKRLSYVKKKLLHDPELYAKYKEKIHEYMDNGYARFVPPDELSTNNTVCYIPHHSTGSKFCVVFDCAARYQGLSLNDCLLPGFDNTNSLVGVLLRFRQECVALVGDIKAMFHQIFVDPSDVDALRFLWWPNDDLTLPPVDCQMLVHPFGATSSPSIAGFVLRRTASDNATKADQETVQTVQRNFYVDDLLKSVESIEKAKQLVFQLQDLLRSGGFHLAKLMSNCMEVLNAVSDDDKAPSFVNLDSHELPVEKTLGIYWNSSSDEFMVKVRVDRKTATRRGVLSMVSQVFDPLGFMQPFVLPVKKLLQQSCCDKLDWDEELSADQVSVWNQWIDTVKQLEDITVRRCFKPIVAETVSMQLHVFCDASLCGYGAVAYIRTVSGDDSVNLSLVMGKSRVSPIKPISVPRLELTAAVVGVKLGQLIVNELEYQFEMVVYWTDSTTVLQYISNTTTRFKIFVANRLELIHNATNPGQWRHVSTKQNPADIASRGLMPSQKEKAKMWFEGPQFLYKSEDEWPTQPCVLQKLPEDDAELKRKSNVFHVVSQEDVLNRLISKYSSLISLQKAVAWLTRFKRYLYLKCENCENLNDPKFELTVSLTAKELNDALLDIVRFVQHDVFAEEIEILHNHDNFDDLFQLGAKSQLRKSGRLNSLRKLSPVVVNGIMYVGGRLQKSPLTVDEKHQIILPSDHHFTKLIIDYYHKREGHCGTLHVLSAVRERFWVIKGQSTVRKTLTDCRICRFWKAKPGEQIMAPLPAERVTPGNAAFSHVGVDYMGPLMVKLGRSTVKRYACVFTCLATRAVHIEVAYSLETDSFLNAYHRFCSRRGTPKSVYSDNGTNFTGAERELRECLKKWQQSTIHDTLCQQGVEWKFSPPAASHQGGVWERMIRSIRKIMRSLVGDKLLDDESLYTFLLEVERILNNRPLTPVSDDPRDLNSLTPNMLLLGKVDSSLPIDNFVKADGYKKSWRLAQLLADEFWKRWTREYLPLLQLRQKWFLPRRNFKVGDLVLLIDENTKRGNWPKGLIEQCFPDASGVVRRVKIKTANNTYLRDIRKVCLLEAVD